MSTGSKIAAVAAVAVIAGLFLGPLDAGVAASTGIQSQTDTVTVDATEPSELRGYDLVNGTVAVSYDNGTSVPNSSYTVGYDGGYVQFDDSVTDGATVDVSYDYKATSAATATLLSIWPLLVVLFGLLALAGAMEAMQ